MIRDLIVHQSPSKICTYSRENPKNVPKPLISYFDTRDSGLLGYVSCCELVCKNACIYLLQFICNTIILCLFYARVVLILSISIQVQRLAGLSLKHFIVKHPACKFELPICSMNMCIFIATKPAL